jgi:hypothetical protein
MPHDFLSRYFAAFGEIPGWCSPDAVLLFMAYHQLLADDGLRGHVLEIGVHHGLSAIGLAAVTPPGRRFVAIDLFDALQSENVSHSGLGDLDRFLENMRRFHADLTFVTAVAAPSSAVSARDFPGGFTFCHIDGGHSAAEAYGDLELCAELSLPGGVIALDDYFNPAFPGVGEAAVRFNLRYPGVLQPVAIGFNKALFQRQPAPFDVNARFAEVFPQVCARQVALWQRPVPLFDTAFRAFFDCSRSTPTRLVGVDGNLIGARIEPAHHRVTAPAGETIVVPVHVTNTSRIPLTHGSAPFGLSYHLLGADHALRQFDHPRAWFVEPLAPGASRTLDVPVRVPDEPGGYELEFDIVWEGVLWMKDRGNPTALVQLSATPSAAVTGALSEAGA